MVLELGRGLAVAVEWGETHQLPAPGREHLWSVIALFATANKLLSLFMPDSSILTERLSEKRLIIVRSFDSSLVNSISV